MRALHSKWLFLRHAHASGMAVPDSARVDSIGDARDWAGDRPVVLKPEYSRFGVHVQLHPRGLDDAAPLPLPGNWVVQADPNREEVVHGEVDFAQIDALKMVIDSAGHYARPDVFRLIVDELIAAKSGLLLRRSGRDQDSVRSAPNCCK